MTSSHLDSRSSTFSGQSDPAGCQGDAVGTSWAMGSRSDDRDQDHGRDHDSSRPHVAAPSGSSREHASIRSQPQPAIETQRILTVFGSNTRSGYWEPPERLEVLSLFGGVTLDFTDANLYSGETVVNCLAVFGGIDLIVPADLEVDANGTGLFGGFDLKALKKQKKGIFSRRRSEPSQEFDIDSDDEPPLLRVRGFALFGGVSVKVR